MVKFLRSIDIFQNHKSQETEKSLLVHFPCVSVQFSLFCGSFDILPQFLFVQIVSPAIPIRVCFLSLLALPEPCWQPPSVCELEDTLSKMSMIECCGAKKVINVFGGCHLALVRNLCHLLGEVCTVSAKPRPPHKGLSAGIE